MDYNIENFIKLEEELAQVKRDFEEFKGMTRREIDKLNRALDYEKIQVSIRDTKVALLRKGLETYADKNFWIRVPPYSLAAADKGQLAKDTLRMAYEDETANA